MTVFEWFLLVVVVIAVPLIVAVVVTLWTLERARQRSRRNRPLAADAPVKRRATRITGDGRSTQPTRREGEELAGDSER